MHTCLTHFNTAEKNLAEFYANVSFSFKFFLRKFPSVIVEC